jgi:hypothetical protein
LSSTKQVIEGKIKAAFLQDKIRRFWLENFVSQDLSEAEVLLAFTSLQSEGKLKVLSVLYCDYGHQVWRGPLDKVKSVRNCLQCRECSPPGSPPEDWSEVYLTEMIEAEIVSIGGNSS